MTVFVPLPDESVQFLVAVNALNEVQVAVLLTHTWIGPLLSSVAVKVREAAVDLVNSFPLLMTIVPVGGFVSGTGLAVVVAPDEVLPALSMAHIRYP